MDEQPRKTTLMLTTHKAPMKLLALDNMATANPGGGQGGSGEEIRFAIATCSLGTILVAASTRGICAIQLGDDPEALVHELQRRFPRARLAAGDAVFGQTVAAVVGWVENPNPGQGLPLDIQGTIFQRRVWQALLEIPLGATSTYRQIAQRIGQPTATRAVAQACGANPVAVIIPCHRVVRTDGGLSGYRWGITRKHALLQREGVSPLGKTLKVPPSSLAG